MRDKVTDHCSISFEKKVAVPNFQRRDDKEYVQTNIHNLLAKNILNNCTIDDIEIG